MLVIKADQNYYYRKINRYTSLIADLSQILKEISIAGDAECLVISRNNLNNFRNIHPFFEYEKSVARAKFGSAFKLKDPRKTYVFVSDKIEDGIVYGFFHRDKKGGFADFFSSIKLISESPILDTIYDSEKYLKLVSSLNLK